MVVIPDKIVDFLSSMFEDVRDKQFIIGDTLIEIVNATGDKGGTIAYLAGKLGVSASTLYDYYRISKLWTPEYRAIGKMIALGKRIYEQDTLDIEQREAIHKAIGLLEEVMRELEVVEFADV